MKWRKIETAPKGVQILGWREVVGITLVAYTYLANILDESKWGEYSEEELYSEDWFYADFGGGGRLDSDHIPSHWQPLPTEPRTGREYINETKRG
jgi:hypothetical protein